MRVIAITADQKKGLPMPDIATLRLRAFSIKLALRRVAACYHSLCAAHLLDALPEREALSAAPALEPILAEFRDVHVRMEAVLFDEMCRLALAAEAAVNDYVRMHYGFGPGDVIQVPLPRDGTLPVRVSKVFLQSGADSDLRVDGAIVQADGTAQRARWDIYLAGPGQFQSQRMQVRERVDSC